MRPHKQELPRGWLWEKIGSVCQVYGGGTPRRKIDRYFRGSIPWATPADVTALKSLEIWDTATKITEEAISKSAARLLAPGCVLLTSRATIGFTAINPVPMCTNQGFANLDCGPRVLNYYLAYYLSSIKETLLNRAGGSIYREISKSTLKEIEIPLPPLPVQERIVEILQKADEIRRKRRKALELANKILPALFLEMFGDPATNPKGWPREPIGALVHFDTAQITPEPGETYLYLAPEHIESHTGHYTGPHPTDGRDLGSAKHPFTSEHVLYCKLRPYLNKVVLPHTAGICSTELVPLRPGSKLLREFLGIYFRLPFFVALAAQKSQGTKMPRFGPELMKRETMIVPPVPLQQAFCLQASQLMEASQRLKEALSLSSSCFEGLLSRAFTGELTAKWEAANAEEIAKQQAFHERLPRLLVLALIAEKAKRASRAAAEVLVTALMKYVFLLQMEGNGARRRLYHFVPYHYGPFAKELYADLKKLQEEGLVTVDNDSEEEKTRIALADPERVEKALADLPDDLKEDVAAIIDQYSSLGHEELLRTVYEKYPSYAKKSLRRKRT
jgi:type I restriction enzyme S subunit